MWKPLKMNNKWYIYNTQTGTLLKKFCGKGTKQEALKACEMRNK